ncbi:similar to Saccharomyces cerevisiae YAL028W FRT2 Tail-anchored ER membrane protein, interacts with homolog Frt1p [Maudiozyma saulgeensis]|uniref:Similar to Saccharomyces cerevisiae YAL028W FRT2 Tail-anchored ER membrane protein, interacts with homolog Frt1p n=1 Tax=Maudiozyma saulgeensis TaxID=1789683 RepID=A0A1X7R2Z4_9SACH|nr:similar to Saccharomyces cerevisiae YAL028W FRT2 Tail-anchored ER membrane protein, interacts with homolog Frt1p [Kazachstania saulgeensis]
MDLLVDRMERKDREGVPAFLSMGGQNKRWGMEKFKAPSVEEGSTKDTTTKLQKSPLIVVNDVPITTMNTEEQDRSMLNLQRYFSNGYDEHAMISDSDSEDDSRDYSSRKLNEGTRRAKIIPVPTTTGSSGSTSTTSMRESGFDVSAAGTGRFSDLEFNFHVSPKSHTLAVSHSPSRVMPTPSMSTTEESLISPRESRNGSISEMSSMHRRSSMFLSTPSSAFMKNGRSMSSHFSSSSSMNNKKRLVNQFLKPSEMENEPSQAQYHSTGQLHQLHRPSTSSSSGISSLHAPFSTMRSNELNLPHRDSNTSSSSSSYTQLHNVLLKDLDSSKQPSSNQGWTLGSSSSSPFPSIMNMDNISSSEGSKSVIPKTIAPEFRSVNYNGSNAPNKAAGTSNYQPQNEILKTKDEDPDMSLYYEKHIHKSLSNLQSKLKETFQNKVIQEEIKFTTMLQHFDQLSEDYDKVNKSIRELRDAMDNNYNTKVKQRFNLTDKKSFQCQMNCTIGDCVKDLQSLEARMRACQDKLASQKETIRKFDNLLVVENTLQELDKNTNSMHKYKYFVCDVVLVSMIAMAIMLYRHTPSI